MNVYRCIGHQAVTIIKGRRHQAVITSLLAMPRQQWVARLSSGHLVALSRCIVVD